MAWLWQREGQSWSAAVMMRPSRWGDFDTACCALLSAMHQLADQYTAFFEVLFYNKLYTDLAMSHQRHTAVFLRIST
jgi:hypothetical protein